MPRIFIYSGLLMGSPEAQMTRWRHQMETFSALLVICAMNSPVNFPHKGQWRGALIFSLIWAWINAWVNNREAGDLRRHRAHYDVIVMDLPAYGDDHIRLYICSIANFWTPWQPPMKQTIICILKRICFCFNRMTFDNIFSEVKSVTSIWSLLLSCRFVMIALC